MMQCELRHLTTSTNFAMRMKCIPDSDVCSSGCNSRLGISLLISTLVVLLLGLHQRWISPMQRETHLFDAHQLRGDRDELDFPGLSVLPGLLPFLGTNVTVSCPPDDPKFLVARNTALHYELVTYGFGEVISQICLDSMNLVEEHRIFFEEYATRFAVDLLRSVAAIEYINRLENRTEGCIVSRAELPWMLDVGANIGVFSVAAAAAGFPVIAIEATPGTALRLSCSAARNNAPHLRVINAAVADHDAPTELCIRVRGGDENVGANTMESGSGCNADSGMERIRTSEQPPNFLQPSAPVLA